MGEKLFAVCVLVVMVLVFFFGIARAEEVKEPINVPSLNLPDMQGGIIYSAKKSDFEVCGTATALKYSTKIGDLELRAGYATEREPIGAICFKLGDLTKFGFEQPLHKIINVSAGGYVGYDFQIKEWDFGVIGTIVQLKW